MKKTIQIIEVGTWFIWAIWGRQTKDGNQDCSTHTSKNKQTKQKHIVNLILLVNKLLHFQSSGKMIPSETLLEDLRQSSLFIFIAATETTLILAHTKSLAKHGPFFGAYSKNLIWFHWKVKWKLINILF